MPFVGQEIGGSTPVQLVQLPLQAPAKAQLAKPATLMMVHWSPALPTTVIPPLGLCTVTVQRATPCMSIPPGHFAGLKTPPLELVTLKLKL